MGAFSTTEFTEHFILLGAKSGQDGPPGTASPRRQPPGPPRVRRDSPKAFNWRSYLALNPDLEQSGIDSEFKAKQHFIQHGKLEGRAFRDFKVRMHYTACTGLINQQYSHIAAFILSSAIGAELVLPPALMRNSFGSYYSLLKEKNEVLWEAAPADMLLDVERIIEAWQRQGMKVHKVTQTCPQCFIIHSAILHLRQPFCIPTINLVV